MTNVSITSCLADDYLFDIGGNFIGKTANLCRRARSPLALWSGLSQSPVIPNSRCAF